MVLGHAIEFRCQIVGVAGRRQVVMAGRQLLAARGMAEAARPARATAGQRGLLALAGEAR
jgi:hypothetical protein